MNFRTIVMSVFLISSLVWADGQNVQTVPADGGGPHNAPPPTATEPTQHELDAARKNHPGVTGTEAIVVALAILQLREETLRKENPKDLKARLEELQVARDAIIDASVPFRKSKVTFGSLNICLGPEIGFAVFGRLGRPGVGGALCITVSKKTEPSTQKASLRNFYGFNVGISSVANAQWEWNSRQESGLDIKAFVTGVVSLNEDVPKQKLGDFEGTYVGITGEGALPANSKIIYNLAAVFGGVYMRAWPTPGDALMVSSGILFGNQEQSINIRLPEIMEYTTLINSDASHPSFLFWGSKDNSAIERLRRAVPDAAAKKLSKPELQRILRSREFQKKVDAALQASLQQNQ